MIIDINSDFELEAAAKAIRELLKMPNRCLYKGQIEVVRNSMTYYVAQQVIVAIKTKGRGSSGMYE